MKIYTITAVLGLLMLWPFTCDAQTTVTVSENCDTIVIENPLWQSQKDAFTLEIERLEGLNADLTTANASLSSHVDHLETQAAGLNGQISSLNNEVTNLKSETQTLNSKITILDIKLAECEAREPEKEIVYQDSDSITVDGVRWAVADIEQILPEQTVDTIRLDWCEADWKKRPFFHEGAMDTYPHFVNFASKTKGMVKVWFTVPADSLIKQKPYLMVQRIISHKEGKRELFYKPELN